MADDEARAPPGLSVASLSRSSSPKYGEKIATLHFGLRLRKQYLMGRVVEWQTRRTQNGL